MHHDTRRPYALRNNEVALGRLGFGFQKCRRIAEREPSCKFDYWAGDPQPNRDLLGGGPAAQPPLLGGGPAAQPLLLSRLVVDVSGASELRLENVEVDDLQIDLSGATSAEVSVTGTISASASGASSLLYHGSPTLTRQDASGASDITQAP